MCFGAPPICKQGRVHFGESPSLSIHAFSTNQSLIVSFPLFLSVRDKNSHAISQSVSQGSREGFLRRAWNPPFHGGGVVIRGKWIQI